MSTSIPQTVVNAVRGAVSSAEALVHDLLTPEKLNHLQALEAESIFIFREAVAEFARPVMLYSIGKDSLRHAAPRAEGLLPRQDSVSPAARRHQLQVPRDDRVPRQLTNKELGAELIVHRNEEAIANNANPFDLGTQNCCGLLKTRSLLDALAEGGYDAAFGGAASR